MVMLGHLRVVERANVRLDVLRKGPQGNDDTPRHATAPVVVGAENHATEEVQRPRDDERDQGGKADHKGGKKIREHGGRGGGLWENE